MRSSSVLAVALALLLATATSAFAASVARVDNDLADVGDVQDEPNTTSGRLPYSAPGEQDRYPGDDDAIAQAKAQIPTDILAVEWVGRACAYGLQCVHAAASPLAALLGSRVILPGAGQFQAWMGTFADYDADGWIRPQSAYDNVHFSLGASECQGTSPVGGIHSGDSDGIGKAQGLSTGSSIRCPRTTEWQGIHAEIVAYVTPGDWSGSDLTNRGSKAWNPLLPPPTSHRESPDLSFQMTPAAPRETSGRYFAPSSDVDLLMIDNSLLETIFIEAFSNPVSSITGPRTMDRGDASLMDVDVYHSLDPAFEALYQALIVAALAEQGCEVSRIEKGCRVATDPLTEPVRASKDDHATSVGPAVAPFFADWERDPQAHSDRSNPHLYLDVFLEASLAVSLVKAHWNSDDFVGAYAPFSNSEVSLSGDGRAHATPQTSVMAYFGIWTDVNADGWIGRPTPSGDCQDVHDCGSRPNPHEYAASEGEYEPLCGKHEIDGMARGADGAFLATLTPEGGKWGLSGVYVLTDRADGGDPDRDPFREDGTAPHNPYDDAFVAPQLVSEGPIEVHMTCTNDDPGFYRSYERLVFLAGSNIEYAFDITGTTTGDYEAQGVPVDEVATDTDFVKGWV